MYVPVLHKLNIKRPSNSLVYVLKYLLDVLCCVYSTTRCSQIPI